MDYLNNEIGIVGNFLPDIYRAKSIDDFLTFKRGIKDPSYWKLLSPLSPFTNMRNAFVLLENTNFSFEHPFNDPITRRERWVYSLSDLTGRVEIDSPILSGITSPKSLKHENLSEGRYGTVLIGYFPSDGTILLRGLKQDRLSCFEDNEEKPYISDLVPALIGR